MKGLNVMTAFVMGLTLMGCASASPSEPAPLSEAYFTYANQLEAGKTLSWKTVSKDLADYSFTEGELMDDESFRLQTFHYDVETLAMPEYTENERSIDALNYVSQEDGRFLNLSTSAAGYHLTTEVEDSTLHQDIAAQLESSPSEMSRLYQEISEALFNKEPYTVLELQERLGVEPAFYEDVNRLVDETSTIATTYYSFQPVEDGEIIGIYTLKGSNQISRIDYHETPESYFRKYTVSSRLLPDGRSVVGLVMSQVPDVPTQENIAKLVLSDN